MSASDAGDAPVTVPATRSASCGLMCVCAACGREFSCQNRLLFHMHEMHGEPVFPCTEAGCCKAFKRRDLLDRHVRDVHMGIRSFRCTVPGCTAAYFTHTNLLKFVFFSPGIPWLLFLSHLFVVDMFVLTRADT